MLKVMIVDDDSLVYSIVKKTIPWEKYQMSVEAYAPNGVKAIEYLTEHSVDILFVDLSMPHMGGLELIRRVYEYLSDTVFIILSSHSEYRFVKESFCTGAFDYLLKVDIDDEEVVDELLKRVTDKHHRMREEGERRFDLGELVSKLNLEEEKDKYCYRIQILKMESDMNRLKIAEVLFHVAEGKNMVYGCYEGSMVVLHYARDEKQMERQLVLAEELIFQRTEGISAVGTSGCGMYSELKNLYREAIRNIDDGFFQIKEYIMQYYQNSELSLQMVADELNLSKRAVSKYIQTYSGLKFKALLNEIRIQAAKEKLLNTNMRIQEIAYATGYTNVEHFTRTFTERVGCSPSHFVGSKKDENLL